MKQSTPTIKDVARMANVSTSTVSLVMNGGNVREHTRARVEEAIHKLRYTRQEHGRRLRSGRSHTIGFFVLNLPEVDDLSAEAADFWFQLIRGVQATCREYEYSFSFESLSWRNPEDLVRRAQSRLNDGAIIMPQYHYHYTFLSDFQHYEYPFVMYNPWVPVGEEHSVYAMDEEAELEMTSYLIEKGRASIAVINGPREHVDVQNRYTGYREALISAGMTPSEKLVRWTDFTMHGGYEATMSLLDEHSTAPDAIVCVNDYLAVGAIHALHARGVRVPDDIAVTGFGDHDVGRSVIPRLTTMALPTREIGECMGNALFAQILGDPHTESTRFHPQLRVHESA